MDSLYKEKITKVDFRAVTLSPSLHLLLPPPPPQVIDTYVHMHASAISVVESSSFWVGHSGSFLVQLLTLGVVLFNSSLQHYV